MTGASVVELPIGLWVDGIRHRRVVLRPLTGSDEEFLLERGALDSLAKRATALLSRCVKSLGPREPVLADDVRQLPVGDREALLLHLRRLTYGDDLAPVIHCPHHACGEKIDLSLCVSDLLVAEVVDLPEYTERRFDGSYGARFRLACGADQEAVAELVLHDPTAAGQMLLERCVDRVWHDDGQECQLLDRLPDQVADSISVAMSELDPQAELQLNLQCPACGRYFSSLFDASRYLLEEVELRSQGLYREVHLLAFHYHWSELEILGMTAAKRRRYLDLLIEALGGEERP